MAFQPNKPGFHTTLTPDLHAEIIANVPGNYTGGQVARMTCIPKQTLNGWLKRGREEAEKDIHSVYSQLAVEFEKARGQEIKNMLDDVRKRLPNWQACWEILRTVAREDFGMEAVEYKELLDLYTKLSEAFKRFTENPIQGGNGNG